MSSMKELLTYKYSFGSLFYEPDSRGAEAVVRLCASGDYSQDPIERKISFFSSILQDLPEQIIQQENAGLLAQLGKCRIRTAWVRYFEDGTIDFQVAVLPHEGKQRFYIRSSGELPEEQRQVIENQVKNAFRGVE